MKHRLHAKQGSALLKSTIKIARDRNDSQGWTEQMQPSDQFDSVHFGHEEVCDQEINRTRTKELYGCRPSSTDRYGVPRLFEQFSEDLSDCIVILSEKNRRVHFPICDI